MAMVLGDAARHDSHFVGRDVSKIKPLARSLWLRNDARVIGAGAQPWDFGFDDHFDCCLELD
jgi:hypothetical protein